MCRAGWLAAAVSIAFAAFPAAVAADQSACQPGSAPPGGDPSSAGGVSLHETANDSVVWCSAAVIQANSDVPDGTTYQVRSTRLSPSSTPVSNAITVSELLTLAGLPPSTVNHTEIQRLNGGFSSLDKADLANPSARFPDGLKPIFWINGSETQYLRPLRGPSDTNGDDAIVASAGSPLDLYVYSGPVLEVTASARPTRVATKQRVSLTSRVTNPAAARGSLIYRWNFQDGTSAVGPSVAHRYAIAGTWYPTVTVQSSGNDAGGVSQPIVVTVGSVPSGTDPRQAGGANPHRRAKPGGPARSPSVTTQPGSAQAGNGSSSARPPGLSPAPAVPPTPVSPTPAPPAPPPRRASPPPRRRAPARPRRRVSAKRSRPHAQVAPGTTLIRGRLIADVVPVSASRLAAHSPVSPSAGRAHLVAAQLGGGSVAPVAAIAGGCVVVLLLGSGAGLELRSRRRPIAPTRAA